MLINYFTSNAYFCLLFLCHSLGPDSRCPGASGIGTGGSTRPRWIGIDLFPLKAMPAGTIVSPPGNKKKDGQQPFHKRSSNDRLSPHHGQNTYINAPAAKGTR